jgi:hypothetical protein
LSMRASLSSIFSSPSPNFPRVFMPINIANLSCRSKERTSI